MFVKVKNKRQGESLAVLCALPLTRRIFECIIKKKSECGRKWRFENCKQTNLEIVICQLITMGDNDLSEKTVLKIFTTILFIEAIYRSFFPYVLGSQIDTKFIKNIDTQSITSNYSLTDEDYDVDENGNVSIFFCSNLSGERVLVYIDILNENKYKSRASKRVFWYRTKRFYEFDTVINVRKNNVEIRIIEFTKSPRSKKAQAYLEEVLAQLES